MPRTTSLDSIRAWAEDGDIAQRHYWAEQIGFLIDELEETCTARDAPKAALIAYIEEGALSIGIIRLHGNRLADLNDVATGAAGGITRAMAERLNRGEAL